MKRLILFIRRVRQGQSHPILLSALYLLLTIGLVMIMMSITNCSDDGINDCNDNGINDCNYEAEEEWQKKEGERIRRLIAKWKAQNARVTTKSAADYEARIVDTTSQEGRASSAQRVQHQLGGEVLGALVPNDVTYSWFPPQGAANLSFPERQPEPGWDPAAPILVFRDVPPDEWIPVEFDLPATSPYDGDLLPEVLDAEPDVGLGTVAYYVNTLAGSTVAPSSLPAADHASRPTLNAPQEMVDTWISINLFTRPITLTSERCQDAVDVLQSEAAFAAVRLPVPAHAVTESVPLPTYHKPLMGTTDYDGDLDMAGEAEVRPGRLAFVANELPPEEGAVWVPFGIPITPTIDCPVGIETGNWEIWTQFTADLTSMPNNCEGCVLDFYFCYEGQTLPGNIVRRAVVGQQLDRTLEHVANMIGGQASVQVYQDWGISCAGPVPLRLEHRDWSEWNLVGGGFKATTPTLTVTLPYTLEEQVSHPPQDIDLTFRSDLDAGWTWSDGTSPLTPPLSYNNDAQPFFLEGTVPTDTADGLYSVYVTATLVTTPTEMRLSTSLVWVGDWVAPPLGPDQHHVYLPLVLRQ